MTWYSHPFQNFPQLIVIHTVKGCGVVNKAEIDVFLELSCFFYDPADVGNLIKGDKQWLITQVLESEVIGSNPENAYTKLCNYDQCNLLYKLIFRMGIII